MKFEPLDTDPPAVVRLIFPVVAPGITKPTRLVPVLEITRAEVPPMLNTLGLERLVPVMVTKLPIGPEEGVKPEMVGAWARTLKKGAIRRIIKYAQDKFFLEWNFGLKNIFCEV